MIQIGDITLETSDPLVLAALIGAGLAVLMVVLLILALRAAARSARATEPLAQQLGYLGPHVQGLAQGQDGLRASIPLVSGTATTVWRFSAKSSSAVQKRSVRSTSTSV